MIIIQVNINLTSTRIKNQNTKPSEKMSKQKQKSSEDIHNQFDHLINSAIFRGSLLGAMITSFVTWNTGKHGRIGRFFKYWHFVKYFIRPKSYTKFVPITKYQHADLNIAANNFYCYSGESGIGKSKHFQNIATVQSQKRPSLYISFKAIGRQANFQHDVAQQFHYQEAALLTSGVIGELIRAVKEIQDINQNGKLFRTKYYCYNLLLLATYGLTLFSPLLLDIQIAFLGPIFYAHYKYLRLMQPLIQQSKKGTIPLVIFDDLNKIQQLGLLPQMTRLFKVLQTKSCNIMMLSSNQQTWAKLRREPGMKDRLIIRQIKYNHEETSQKLLELLQKRPEIIGKYFVFHPLLTTQIMKQMVRVFIGKKQMSIRRFTSVIKLVDEEQYDQLIEILQNSQGKTATQIVQQLRNIIVASQIHTMVANFRSIKRQLPNMSQKIFLQTLEIAAQHQKLPSDNRIGALLKVYNIMRDKRSQYIISGAYVRNLFRQAIEQYTAQIQEFNMPPYKQSDFHH